MKRATMFPHFGFFFKADILSFQQRFSCKDSENKYNCNFWFGIFELFYALFLLESVFSLAFSV